MLSGYFVDFAFDICYKGTCGLTPAVFGKKVNI